MRNESKIKNIIFYFCHNVNVKCNGARSNGRDEDDKKNIFVNFIN